MHRGSINKISLYFYKIIETITEEIQEFNLEIPPRHVHLCCIGLYGFFDCCGHVHQMIECVTRVRYFRVSVRIAVTTATSGFLIIRLRVRAQAVRPKICLFLNLVSTTSPLGARQSEVAWRGESDGADSIITLLFLRISIVRAYSPSISTVQTKNCDFTFCKRLIRINHNPAVRRLPAIAFS